MLNEMQETFGPGGTLSRDTKGQVVQRGRHEELMADPAGVDAQLLAEGER